MTSMLDYFQMEAAERLEQLSTGLIELEGSPHDAMLVSRLFREAHSLKGAAAVTGLADVSHVCHLMEDLLSDVRDGTTLPDNQLIDKLLSATDGVEQLIAAELGQDKCAVSADDIVARLTEARSGTSPPSTSASLLVDAGNLPNSPPTDVSPPHKRSETTVPDADTRVDRHVLEELRDPVTQLVRNAIGHGIEAPDEREWLGKPRSGCVRLITSRQGDRIRIVCEDDGRGIDRQKVIDRAVAAGLVRSRDAAALSPDQIDRFILAPGLSTADAVTDISGRGVGMDVVASRIELLHGTLHVESEPGRFTRIVLELPAGVATLDGLVVDVAEHTYVIPTSLVESADRIAPSQLQRGAGGEVLAPWQGRPIPVLSLAQLLGRHQTAAPSNGLIPVVVVRHRGQPIAFTVDRLQTTQTVVAKNLVDELGNLCGVTGATILSSGVPALILDPAQFLSEQIDYAVGNDLIENTTDVVEEAAPFLIVDDSVTTRMMEKSILESAGYRVELAVSAEDVLQKSTPCAYRLFVIDVEMPGMNGFELTRKLRQDPNYAETPVIIVSSLSSDDQRREGLEAGANAYIVKGEFDQNALLDTIERLVGS